MTTAPFVHFFHLPTLIDAPGLYRTRLGGRVRILRAGPAGSWHCKGYFQDSGVIAHWHTSGRREAGDTSPTDLVAKL